MSGYRISELAERCGVSASTLRFYEAAGLLPAKRTAAGYRTYGDEAVRRLEFIASAKHLGLPLEEIRELLQVWQEGVCGTVRARLLPLVRARRDEAEARIAELTAFTTNLTEVHDQMSGPAPDGACDPDCGCVTAPPRRPSTGARASQRTVVGTPTALELPRARPESTAMQELSADQAWEAQPVVCSLDGSSMSERIEQWHRLLASSTGRTPIAGGLCLTFPADPALALEVTRLAAAEQECCAFFDFTLHLTPGGLELIVRAPDASAGLLADVFGPAK